MEKKKNKVTPAQKAAGQKWDKKQRSFAIRLNPDRDAKLIERLDQIEKKTDYFRELILADIEGRIVGR